MDRGDYYLRLVDLEFTPRDVYRSERRLSTEFNVAGPGWHGVLEAPVSPRGSWNIVRHEEFPDGYAIQGEAGDTLWIRFSGSSLDLHLDPAASTGSISVTIHDGTQGTERGS